ECALQHVAARIGPGFPRHANELTRRLSSEAISRYLAAFLRVSTLHLKMCKCLSERRGGPEERRTLASCQYSAGAMRSRFSQDRVGIVDEKGTYVHRGPDVCVVGTACSAARCRARPPLSIHPQLQGGDCCQALEAR